MEQHLRTERLARRLGQGCAALPALAALVAGGAWLGGYWPLATFGAGPVPMAPSTSVLLLLVSAAALLQARWPGRRATQSAVVAVLALTLLVTGLLFVQVWRGAGGWWWDVWLTGNIPWAGGAPARRMALLTALMLDGLAAALCLAAVAGGRRAPRRLATALVLLVWLTCLVVALSYLAGATVLYSGVWRPPTLPTVVLLAMLGLGMLTADFPQHWTLRLLAGELGDPLAHRFGRVLLSCTLLMVAGLLGAGVLYLRRQLAEARSFVQQNLSAVAGLKAERILQWRRELTHDLRFFSRTAASREAQAWLATPASAQAQAGLRRWLEVLRQGERFQSAALFDPEANLCFAVPSPAETADPRARREVAATLRAGDVLLGELQPGPDVLQMDALFPVFAPPDPARAEPARALAVVRLRLDAGRFLDPFLAKPPPAGAKAKTQLVWRDADTALCLPSPRPDATAPRTVRLALDRTEPAAVRAVLGAEGLFEGVDPHTNAVLAAVCAVPDSPWRVLATVTQAEVYVAAREQVWVLSSGFAVLALALGLGAGLLWQLRGTERLQLELAARQEQAALAQRLAHLMDSTNDVIMLSDTDRRIVEVNRRAEEVYGYSVAELKGMALEELRAPETRAEFDAARARYESATSIVFQTRHRRKDSSTFPVEVSSRWVQVGSQRLSLGVLRDITSRTQAEGERERLLAILERTPDVVGIADPQGRVVYLNATGRRLLGWGDDFRARPRNVAEAHPAWAAELVLAEGLPAAQRDGLWIGETALHTATGTEMPVSQVILAQKDARGEVTHYSTIMRDLSERKRIEQMIRRNEERLRTIIEHSSQLFYAHTPEHVLTYLSPQSRQFLDCEPEEALGRSTQFLTDHPVNAHGLARTETAIRTGQRQPPHELELISRQGRKLWVEVNESPVVLKGKTVAVVGSLTDITARKQAEAALHDLSGRLLAAQDDERRRIARDLHDTTAQTIAALCMNLTLLSAKLPAAATAAARLLADATALGQRAGQEIRTVSYLLHPPILEHAGLAGAIREYAGGFTRRSGIQVQVEVGVEVGRFAPEIELALLRVVQESLGNVHRHSGSPTAVIRLRRAGAEVQLDIEDAGKGFAPPDLSAGGEGALGVGIAGMRERLRHLGGRLEIVSNTRGTVVKAFLPWPGDTQPGKN